jgi:agmatinase
MGGERDFRIEESELRSDDEFAEFSSEDLPYYSDWHGSFEKLPWATDDAALAAAKPDVAIVGAPLDDAVSGRPGARFGPRAIRQAPTAWGVRYAWSIQLDVEPYADLAVVDAGDAPVVPARLDRGLRVIHEKVFRVARSGAIPIVLGGDHSITYPSAAAVARHRHPRSVGIVHFDAHADTGEDQWGSLVGHGTPMRRLIEEGWVAGPNFVQVGLRGYWPDRETFEWMRERGLRWHTMVEIEERGSEAVISDAIAEALDGPDCIYLSVDIDVVDPGMAPGTGTPEAGGMLSRELLRAIRQIVGQVDLVGMDVVEVSPPYDHAEVTSALAHRCVMEAISALAARRRDAR